MKKKTYNFLIVSCLLFLPLFSFGQLSYSDKIADYQVVDKGSKFEVTCELKIKISSSSRLRLSYERLRLKAIDLIGNYIVFQELDIDEALEDPLFAIFVDYTDLKYTADIEKFSDQGWQICESNRCINFSCKKKDFYVQPEYFEQKYDLSEMLLINFRRRNTIEALCMVFRYSVPSLTEMLELEHMFMQGIATISDDLSRLQEYLPSERFDISMFSNDTSLQALSMKVYENPPQSCSFGRMISSRVLFTSVKPAMKNRVYKDFITDVAGCKGIWYDMLHFAAINCYGNEDQLTSAAESDIFEMIQMYPGALDVYGMNIGYNGQDYDSAVYFFSQEMPEIALDHLRNAINFNGITAESLNLSAASYRLVGEYKKALPFLILAYYLDRSSPYIPGNICLVLNELNYPKLGILIDSLLNGSSLDPWSKNEIENLKSTLQ